MIYFKAKKASYNCARCSMWRINQVSSHVCIRYQQQHLDSYANSHQTLLMWLILKTVTSHTRINLRHLLFEMKRFFQCAHMRKKSHGWKMLTRALNLSEPAQKPKDYIYLEFKSSVKEEQDVDRMRSDAYFWELAAARSHNSLLRIALRCCSRAQQWTKQRPFHYGSETSLRIF